MDKVTKIIRLFLVLTLLGVMQDISAQNKPNSTGLASKTPVTIPLGYRDGSSVNYVRSYVVYKPGVTEANIPTSSVTDVQQITQFVDALGRPIQTVTKQSTPNQNDMVQLVIYDGFGRVTYEYMPYQDAETNGLIKEEPFSAQSTFMNAHFGDEDIFYGITEYENSPLNRATKVMAPGNSWAGSDRGIATSWSSNTDTDGIRLWTVGTSGNPSTADDYDAGELAVVTSTEEDGNQVRQYTDKLGRVVLKKVQKASGTAEGHSDWMNTYYIYDDYNNLRFVLPPKAVEELSASSWVWNSTDMDQLVFQYTYDERNRMITKRVPGAEEVRMVYDKLDRLVATQDGNQREADPAEWTFTKYDQLNRPVITGIYKSNDTHTTIQAQVDAWSSDLLSARKNAVQTANTVEGQNITTDNHVSGTTLYRVASNGDIIFLPGFKVEGEETETRREALSTDFTFFMGYYDGSFPDIGNGEDVLTVNYYDDYDFTTRTYIDHAATLAGGTHAVTPAQYKYVTSLATGSKVKVLGTTDQWLTTVMFYDDRGRVIQTQTDNHKGGEDIVSTQYDFSGKVLSTYTDHDNPAATNGSTTVLKKFVYDHAGRLEYVEQKLNGTGSFKRLVTNAYNELGELETKKLGDATTPIETLDYKYNVRGWMRSINGDFVDDENDPLQGDRYFGMELSYDVGFDDPQYNGNIAGVKWRSKSSEDRARAYGFDYDQSNRLLAADYTQYESSSWTNNTMDFSTAYSYDVNGNIETLDRWGVIAGTKTLIDELTYTYYANNNQLKYVQDVKGDMGQGDFKGDNSTGTDYDYDKNGNMTQDGNKTINSNDIKYNHLNLPTYIEFDNSTSKTITYVYDAAGIKLQKKVNDGGTITTTDYIAGFIYENDAFQQFAHEEGRTRLKTGGGTVNDYYVKDHLGNTRMTLTEEESSTVYFASMETEYEDFEENLFLNLDNSRVVSTAGNKTIDPAITANEASRLNGSDADRRVGPGKLLAVSAGDSVDMEVHAYYTGTIGSNNPITESLITTAVAGAFGGLSSAPAGSESKAIYDLFDDTGFAVLVGSGATHTDQPRAYLNYMFFDQDFNFVVAKSGYQQISSDAKNNPHELISSAISIEEGGYLYVYVSNESDANFDVFFDDLRITHHKGTILQEDHYYPFGMTMSALSSITPLGNPNNFDTFQGQERTGDLGLNWIQFKWRNHDPQIGRFFNVDPLSDKYVYNSTYAFSENKVTSHIELEGLEAVRLHPSYGMNNIVEVFRQIFDAGASSLSFKASAGTTQKTKLSEESLGPNTSISSSVNTESSWSISLDLSTMFDNEQSFQQGPIFEAGSQTTTTEVTETQVKLKAGNLPMNISSSNRDNVTDGTNEQRVEVNVGLDNERIQLKSYLRTAQITESDNTRRYKTSAGIRAQIMIMDDKTTQTTTSLFFQIEAINEDKQK